MLYSSIELNKSSGNVFADVGIPHSEEHFAKAELAHQISQIIQKRGLKQVEAAKALGIDQAKISALMRGILKGFSIERLFKFLILLDQDIEITIKPCQANMQDETPNHHIHIHCVGA